MTILTTLMVLSGLWTLRLLIGALWSIFLPRSAWKWDRGAEIKNAEPSFFGLVAQVGRGLRSLVLALAFGALTYFFFYLGYGHPQNFSWPVSGQAPSGVEAQETGDPQRK